MKERPNEQALSSDFEFEALQAAKNYRKALVTEFAPFLKGAVIEVGAGIGQITSLLRNLPEIERLLSVEPDSTFCENFRKNLPGQSLLEGTVESVTSDSAWNGILSINVLEHIRDDEQELEKYRALLRTRTGYLNLFVPARQEIYAPIDRDFGHHRRYSRAQLKEKLERAGFSIVRLHYFNSVGYLAWWFTFCVRRQRKFGLSSVWLYDRVIFPFVYRLESRIGWPPLGQSLLAIGRAD